MVLLAGLALAAPFRGPLPRPERVEWEPGRQRDVLVVKIAEDAGLRWEGSHLVGPGAASLNRLLQGARPLFLREGEELRAERRSQGAEGRLADLSLYLRLQGPDVQERGQALLADPRVETAYLQFAPMPPPTDLAPTTPDFTAEQGYLWPGPSGFDVEEAWRWSGARGAGITIADVEYDWEVEHEDLEAAAGEFAWGWDSGLYAFHGTMVLGQIVAGDNGYGVVGMVPEASVLMVSPFSEADVYDVAAAIDGAASLLSPGDVLLIEQQAYAHGNYCPVEVDPAVFDAIASAVARGIVVVEPGGNGAQDLDADYWEGWFDRSLQDSGAILVGGGASPSSGLLERAWIPGGSSYGSRVDLQGWYDGIASTTNGDYDGAYANLFYPEGDGRQGYTDLMGGTSGASPLVVGVVVAAQAVAIERWGEPWDPIELRAALVSTGQPDQDPEHPIGPQPDLRRLLWTWGLR